jgi:hypothetical protein
MPTVLRKYGYRFHFYGSDMHEPPHIHVTGNGGKAKVWLASGEFAESAGLNNAEKRRILDAIQEHRREMMEAWNEFFRSVS